MSRYYSEAFVKTKLGKAPEGGAPGIPLSDSRTTQSLGYNEELAKILSYISAWSYSDLDTFESKLKDLPSLQGANFCQVRVVNDAMFVVAYAQIIRTSDERTMIISFRGTEITNVVSYLTDAGTRKADFPPKDNGIVEKKATAESNQKRIQVHSGFSRNWQQVWNGSTGVAAHLEEPYKMNMEFKYPVDYDENDTVRSFTDAEQDKLENIYITGHSLGGAMALLAGLQLHSDTVMWNKLKAIYTFGQPMVVGSGESREEAQEILGDKLHRFVYYNDLVPHLPPVTTGGFDHIGKEFKYIPDSAVLVWPWKFGNKGKWKERKFCIEWNDEEHCMPKDIENLLDKVWIRSRTTQVGTLVGAVPFALADYLCYNVPLLSFIKMPWSVNDHIPYFYVNSFFHEK